MIEVMLLSAFICFNGQCHPALVGPKTKPGTYEVSKLLTDRPGYGGDVLKFHEDADTIYAIHRVWTLKPKERREQRLKSWDPLQRRNVTDGCINVEPQVYELLLKCCSNAKLVIKNS